MAVQQEVEEKTGEVTVTNLKQFLQLILMHKSFQQFYHSGFGRSKRFQATQINQFGLDPQVPAPAKRDTAPGVKKVKMVGDSCIFSKFLLNGPSGLAWWHVSTKIALPGSTAVVAVAYTDNNNLAVLPRCCFAGHAKHAHSATYDGHLAPAACARAI